MKKILIFSPGGGDMVAASLKNSFKQLGHRAEIYFQDNYCHPTLFLFKIAAKLNLKLAVYFWEKYKIANGSAYENKVLSWQPDLVLMYGFNSISSQLIRKIRDVYRIPIAYWIFADPLISAKLDAYYFDHLIDCSHIFYINGSAMPSLKLLSKAQFCFLPVAADPRFYKPLSRKKDIDLIMVGNFSAISVSTITKAYILDKLCQAGLKVSAAGAGLDKFINDKHFPYLRRLDVIKSHFLSIEEINELYNRAKIVLAPEHPRDKDSPSPRVCEAALAGTFPLADYQTDTAELFEGAAVTFRSTTELIDLVKYYLSHEEEREELAKKIHQITIAKHTYLARAEKILSTVFSDRSN